MDNYRTIATKLENRESFRGNSLWASWLNSTQYTVFSYSTPIAEIDTLTGKVWVSDKRYSNTTTRGQNLVKRAWGLN